MRYPIINGVIPPLEKVTEYHIVTAAGIVSCTFDEKKLAEKRFKEIANPTWHLVEVVRTLNVLSKPVNRPTLVAA